MMPDYLHLRQSAPSEARTVARRWRRSINSLILVLPTLMFIEYLVLRFGLSEGTQRDIGVNVPAATFGVAGAYAAACFSALFHWPFWILGILGRGSIERQWPRIAASQWAIIGSAAALTALYMAIGLAAAFEMLSGARDAGQGFGIVLTFAGPFIAAPLGVAGWWTGRALAVLFGRGSAT